MEILKKKTVDGVLFYSICYIPDLRVQNKVFTILLMVSEIIAWCQKILSADIMQSDLSMSETKLSTFFM